MRVAPRKLDDRYDGDGGRSVILVGEVAFVISPLAATLLTLIAGHRSSDVDDLTAQLLQEFGTPPVDTDAGDMVVEVCEQLAALGAISIVKAT